MVDEMVHQIKIYLGKRRLQHFQGDRLLQEYPIAVGKPSTPTPTGEYRVINKILNPGGPFGTRWMGISAPGVGIHGTNTPRLIGYAVSHGCIRMHNEDVEKLYPQIPVGTKVTILP